ncbi:MAG: hypothetical protein J5699_03760 [Bacteroidales bacterium]|nr:hypothetical protein [Bacteroidales bacterium]
MKKLYLTPDKSGYLAPRSIELPMETEQCIASSGLPDSGEDDDDWDD